MSLGVLIEKRVALTCSSAAMLAFSGGLPVAIDKPLIQPVLILLHGRFAPLGSGWNFLLPGSSGGLETLEYVGVDHYLSLKFSLRNNSMFLILKNLPDPTHVALLLVGK